MPVDVNHPSFPAPPPETILWRYLSLPKLLSLLVSSELFLPSLRILRNDDPFEGRPTIQNQRLAATLSRDEEFAQQFFKSHFPELTDDALAKFKESFIGALNGTMPSVADTCFASCWHARRQESAALWKLYAESQAGIAIKCTVSKLCEAIDTDKSLILGAVRYCDFENSFTDINNILHAAFTKRDSYEHEHEVRLLHWELKQPMEERAGITVPCNPSILIEEIVVSPYADDWMVSTVAEVIRRIGFESPVRKSRLLDTSLD